MSLWSPGLVFHLQWSAVVPARNLPGRTSLQDDRRASAGAGNLGWGPPPPQLGAQDRYKENIFLPKMHVSHWWIVFVSPVLPSWEISYLSSTERIVIDGSDLPLGLCYGEMHQEWCLPFSPTKGDIQTGLSWPRLDPLAVLAA